MLLMVLYLTVPHSRDLICLPYLKVEITLVGLLYNLSDYALFQDRIRLRRLENPMRIYKAY